MCSATVIQRAGARIWCRLAGASWLDEGSQLVTLLVSRMLRESLHNAPFCKVPASQSRAPLVAVTASRPSGLQNRRYAKFAPLSRLVVCRRSPLADAPYAPSSVALSTRQLCGIYQALRASFWSAASPGILCRPPPTPGLACCAASPARSARPPPKGAPSEPRRGHAA